MKLFWLFTLGAIAASPLARADSFCAYEAGLVDTTGVGYLAPYEVVDAVYDWETKRCEIPVFIHPGQKQADIIECLSIEAFPSEYHDQEAYVTGLLARGYPLEFSDYFAFLVYEWRDGYAQIKLRSGDLRWIDFESIRWRARYDRNGVIGRRGLRSSTHIYTAPDLSAVAPAENVSGEIPTSFLRALYEYEDLPYKIPENSWDWMIQTDPVADYFFDFSYHVTGVVADDNGALWYEVDEHMAIDALVHETKRPELESILGAPINGTYYSPIIRSVYIPYRDANSVVKSVFYPGPYCD